jgi:hypothetical protein
VRRRGATLLAAVVVVVGGGDALAHPPPMGTGLWWVPATGSSSSERLVIRTPRGFVIESPATSDFRLLCNEAVGIQDGEEASFADLNGDAFLMATYGSGVLRGSADACTWTPITAAITTPAFDVIAAGADGIAYVVGGAPHQGDHFFAARNAGVTWSALANSDFPYTRVRAARSNPSRLYLTGIGLDDMEKAIHRLGVSDDGGKTVVDRTIALGPHDLQARVLDVDPLHPDHLYIHVESSSAEIPEHILVSTDAGQSFTTGPSLRDIHGFAQSDDGSKVWVGGKEGIYRSLDGGGSFSPLANQAMTGITCLAFHQNRLYACGVRNDRLVVAVSEDGSDDFREVFSFDQVKANLDCPGAEPAKSPATVCSASLNHWRSELGTLGSPPTDASASTGGSSGSSPDAGTDPPRRATSSGCSVGGFERSSAGGLTFALTWAVLAGLARSKRHAITRFRALAARPYV